MKKFYYNAQLLSSFLLNKTKIVYFSLAIILYGSFFFPVILCDEEIMNSSPNESNPQEKEKQKFWIAVGVFTIVSIICLYFFIKGIPSC